MAFAPYDPSWLVELALQQYPEEPWLHDALRACTQSEPVSEFPDDGIYFIDRMEGEFWQNVILVCPVRGKIVLDILTDRRVGGLSTIELPLTGQ